MKTRPLAIWPFAAACVLALAIPAPRVTARAAGKPARSRAMPRQARSQPVRSAPVSSREITALRRAGDVYSGTVVVVDAYRQTDDDSIHRSGAGVLITRSGYVFAPLFVVDRADVVIVRFGAEFRSPARVLAKDASTHLAILKTSLVPENAACPPLCEQEGEKPETAVVMVSLSETGPSSLVGSVVGSRKEAGPLRDVLEVDVRGVPGALGGVLLNGKGELVGLALATMIDEVETGAKAQSAKVYVLPSSRIRSAIDRILEGTPGTDTERNEHVSVA
jgi:S1-C subfamily serine protease